MRRIGRTGSAVPAVDDVEKGLATCRKARETSHLSLMEPCGTLSGVPAQTPPSVSRPRALTGARGV